MCRGFFWEAREAQNILRKNNKCNFMSQIQGGKRGTKRNLLQKPNLTYQIQGGKRGTEIKSAMKTKSHISNSGRQERQDGTVIKSAEKTKSHISNTGRQERQERHINEICYENQISYVKFREAREARWHSN